ncbi:hypothetical protein AcV5_002430 [Taiwanofungus camphoratus]|nr:hypothetical protein AcV5_002430 [Antrodia cinnamomea]
MAQGDQVRIISSEQTGLQGRILTLTDRIAEIGLNTVDIRGEDVVVDIVSVPLECLQRHFKVGDNVRVQAGAQYGREGIVIVVGMADLTFAERRTDESVEVLQDDVTWHDPQLTFVNPESVPSDMRLFSNCPMQNPWIMQMVQVISGLFKGYLGYIKSVNVSTIDVEMVTS